MSLFDVIRYPVTSILNLRELEPIPQEILRPWARACIETITPNRVDDIDKVKPVDYVLTVYSSLVDASSNESGGVMLDKLEIYLEYALMLLKAHIRDA